MGGGSSAFGNSIRALAFQGASGGKEGPLGFNHRLARPLVTGEAAVGHQGAATNQVASAGPHCLTRAASSSGILINSCLAGTLLDLGFPEGDPGSAGVPRWAQKGRISTLETGRSRSAERLQFSGSLGQRCFAWRRCARFTTRTNARLATIKYPALPSSFPSTGRTPFRLAVFTDFWFKITATGVPNFQLWPRI